MQRGKNTQNTSYLIGVKVVSAFTVGVKLAPVEKCLSVCGKCVEKIHELVSTSAGNELIRSGRSQ